MSVVQQVGFDGGAGTTKVVTIASTTFGNTLMVFSTSNTTPGGVPTDNLLTSWPAAAFGPVGSSHTVCYALPNCPAGITSVTVNIPGAQGWIVEENGLLASSVDKVASSAGTSPTLGSGNTATLSQPNEVCYGLLGHLSNNLYGAGSGWDSSAFINYGGTGGGGYTPGNQGNVLLGQIAFLERRVVSSTAAVNATMTTTGTVDVGVITLMQAAAVTIYDGTTASGTVVSTGTGGAALPAFNLGDCIHVIIMAQTASALTDSGPSDGANAYIHLGVADNHGTRGFIFTRWMTTVTTPLATPVITDTWSGTAKLAIAVAKVPSVSPIGPNVPGGNAQASQTAPSGTDSQSSGLTVSANTLVPVTLSAWGFSVSEAGAPAAGTGFTQVGTAWAALGAACLTYETAVSSLTQQQVATFTPIGGSDTYAFMDLFNQNSPPPVSYALESAEYF